jgi:hypothetical protein
MAGKTYANLLLSRDVYDAFRSTCDRLGMKYNAQVEIMMKKFNEEHGEPYTWQANQ